MTINCARLALIATFSVFSITSPGAALVRTVHIAGTTASDKMPGYLFFPYWPGRVGHLIDPHLQFAYGGHNFDRTPSFSTDGTLIDCDNGRDGCSQSNLCRAPADLSTNIGRIIAAGACVTPRRS
jgi:hypothetical protein